MGSARNDVATTSTALLAQVAKCASKSGAFSKVTQETTTVTCHDPIQDAACFRVELEGDQAFVTWVSADRYLSQSIEADLMWTGDDLDDLIDEEVADQEVPGAPLGRVEHFRNEEKQFTFRSRVPRSGATANDAQFADALTRCLIAYQAAFRELGDMKASEDSE